MLPFGRRARNSRILRISDDAFAYCRAADRHTWSLAYLLRGTFGNYLLGAPPFDEALARIAVGIGGIARVLPFEAALADDAARWFTRFGCRWAVPVAAGDLAFGPVPLDPVEHTSFTGLRDVDCRARDGRYGWHFRWRDATVVAGFATDDASRAQRSLTLPPTLVGQGTDLDVAVASMRASLTAASPSEWLRRLGDADPLLCVAVDALGVIACFDDIEFERNDIEIIGPRQRRDLSRLLERHGFERVSPHCFRHREAVVRIIEPPRTQMNEPLNGLALGRGAITFVTATQAAFEILLAPWPVERRLEELLRLVTCLPVNLRKLQTALARRPELAADHDPARLLAHLRGLQAETVAYYKRRRASGLHGRLFVPDSAAQAGEPGPVLHG